MHGACPRIRTCIGAVDGFGPLRPGFPRSSAPVPFWRLFDRSLWEREGPLAEPSSFAFLPHLFLSNKEKEASLLRWLCETVSCATLVRPFARVLFRAHFCAFYSALRPCVPRFGEFFFTTSAHFVHVCLVFAPFFFFTFSLPCLFFPRLLQNVGDCWPGPRPAVGPGIVASSSRVWRVCSRAGGC